MRWRVGIETFRVSRILESPPHIKILSHLASVLPSSW